MGRAFDGQSDDGFPDDAARLQWRQIELHAHGPSAIVEDPIRAGAVAATVRRTALAHTREEVRRGALRNPIDTYERFREEAEQTVVADRGSPFSTMATALADTATRSRFCTPSILPEIEGQAVPVELETSLSDRMVGSSTEGDAIFGEVETELADIHGGVRAFPFIDGSTGAVRALGEWIATWWRAPLVGVNRIAHKAVIHALDAHRVDWYYIDEPRWDPDVDAAGPISPDGFGEGLRSDTTHVWVNSVTYEGVVADVRELRARLDRWSAEAGQQRPIFLADEAWGAHLNFHDEWRQHRALECGADVVTFSAHKQGGARQGTAALVMASSLGTDERHRLEATIRGTVTTSPNFPLVASLQAASTYLREHGTDRLEQSAALARHLRAGVEVTPLGGPVRARPSLESTVGEDAAWIDRLKVLVTVGHRSGLRVAECLSEHHGVVVEKDGFCSVLFLVPFQVDVVDVARAVDACARVARDHTAPRPTVPTAVPFGRRSRRVLSREDRARSVAEPLDRALVGRIAADLVAAYPPGIPVVAPGDEISIEQIDYLLAVAAQEGHVVSSAGSAPTGEPGRVAPSIFVLRKDDT